MDAEPERDMRKAGCALQELAGMGDFLAERAIGRVFVDRIFVARQICPRIGRFRSRPGDEILGDRHDADGRGTAGRLGNVDMGLNHQNLDRQGNCGQQNEQHQMRRSMTHNHGLDAFARGLASMMAVPDHPLPVSFGSR